MVKLLIVRNNLIEVLKKDEPLYIFKRLQNPSKKQANNNNNNKEYSYGVKIYSTLHNII